MTSSHFNVLSKTMVFTIINATFIIMTSPAFIKVNFDIFMYVLRESVFL